MNTPRWIVWVAAAMLLGNVLPALSHHSAAMFDHDKEITITGTVTQFGYANPHGHLLVDVKGEKGETVTYWLEMPAITAMISAGIGRTAFKAGDKVTVTIHPFKDGRPGGRYISRLGAPSKVADE